MEFKELLCSKIEKSKFRTKKAFCDAIGISQTNFYQAVKNPSYSKLKLYADSLDLKLWELLRPDDDGISVDDGVSSHIETSVYYDLQKIFLSIDDGMYLDCYNKVELSCSVEERYTGDEIRFFIVFNGAIEFGVPYSDVEYIMSFLSGDLNPGDLPSLSSKKIVRLMLGDDLFLNHVINKSGVYYEIESDSKNKIQDVSPLIECLAKAKWFIDDLMKR